MSGWWVSEREREIVTGSSGPGRRDVFVLRCSSAGDSTETGGDCVCAGWLVARGGEPGRHSCRHTEFLQRHQLSHRLAQDSARPTQAVPQVDQDLEGGFLLSSSVFCAGLFFLWGGGSMVGFHG